MWWRTAVFSAIAFSTIAPRAGAEELRFENLWSRPLLNSIVNTEFGTAQFPPLVDFTGHHYRVAGNGLQSVEFRYQLDEGGLTPEFGFYHVTPELMEIDVSTEEGQRTYATTALAPGNAEVVFQDVRESPVRTESFDFTGGDLIGFFSLPRIGTPHLPFRFWLDEFRDNPERSTLEGRDSSLDHVDHGGGRWPQFSYSRANPGAFDQMVSVHGTSSSSGNAATMLFWEDASRLADADPFLPGAFSYDGDFNDAVYVVEGIIPVPEPQTIAILASLLQLGTARMARRHSPAGNRTSQHSA